MHNSRGKKVSDPGGEMRAIGVAASARLRHVIKRDGRSQAEIARAVGVAAPTVSNWMRDAHGISIPHLQRLAAVLNVCPVWLAFGDAWSSRILRTAEEKAIVRRFRQMSPDLQKAILQLSIPLNTGAMTAAAMAFAGSLNHNGHIGSHDDE
jgi:transcriptional regulator with XRE-family HTH domain